MAGYTEQDKRNRVDASAFEGGKPFRSRLPELITHLFEAEPDRRAGCRTLRLLDPDGSGAFDRFMKVTDFKGPTSPEAEAAKAAGVLSVQPVMNGITIETRQEEHTVLKCGLVVVGWEVQGYFLGGDNIGEMELADLRSLVRNKVAVDDDKAAPAPVPQDLDWPPSRFR